MGIREPKPRGAPRGLLICALALAPCSALAGAPAAAGTLSAPAAVLSTPATHLATLDTPVDAPRITSPYGWRVHPILKRRRFHKGVDFGAPEGTPVHAAQDGVVEAIGRRGHYGLYLRLRHCDTVETAYAHLAGFTPGLHVGSTVTRGEVIGSVGRTGWATGPHLYYEVIIGGRRVDPDQDLRVPVTQLVQASAPPQPQAATHGGAP